jgi:ribosomal protein L40E
MVKKTLGYVELEWTCPQCGTRNPGPQKACSSCGAAQPKKVEFHQAAEEELITDQAEIAQAKAGPDVHCAFCGARNPAGTVKCTQCGADLSAATARESGGVMGAHREGPAEQIACPQCGTLNEGTAVRCARCNASLPRAGAPPRPSARRGLETQSKKKPARKVGLVGIVAIGVIALIALVACVVIITSLLPSKEIQGQVMSVSWTRSIEIEELRDVTREDWRDEIPADASVGTCTDKLHHTQDQPAANAREVCGTPYTVDKGTGHGEVVQDCQYEVYADWCKYTAREWKQVDTVTLSGQDYSPRWPAPAFGAQQREGDQRQSYKVVFETEEKNYTYETSDPDEYSQYQVGSRWILKVTALGGVRSAEPAR